MMRMYKYALAGFLLASTTSAFAAAIVIGSSSARICYESADSRLMPNVHDLARCDEALADASTPEHDVVATFVNRGILKLRRGQPVAAIADFDAALVRDPGEAEAYLNKGAALIRLDNPREALPLFTAALERNTTRPAIARFGRAVANEALGNVRQAYLDYRAATELDPDWADPRVELARFQVVPR